MTTVAFHCSFYLYSYSPVLVIYCCITTYSNTWWLQNNKHIISHNFCASGNQEQLSWVPLAQSLAWCDYPPVSQVCGYLKIWPWQKDLFLRSLRWLSQASVPHGFWTVGLSFLSHHMDLSMRCLTPWQQACPTVSDLSEREKDRERERMQERMFKMKAIVLL